MRHRLNFGWSLAALSLALGCLSCGGGSEAPAPPVSTFVRNLPDDQIVKTDPVGSDAAATEACYLGWFDGVSQGSLSNLHGMESETGKKAAMVMWYLDWSNAFPTSACNTLWQAGYVPHITWEAWTGGSMTSITHAKILAGDWDTYIDQFGHDIAAWGHPVFLRFGHEMNGDWYPWCSYVNGQTPQTYINAYRRVHDRVVAAGATNVIWIWCPNASGKNDPGGITASYPGNTYVDWTGVDFYNWGTTQSWSSWVQGASILQTPYGEIQKVAPGKPMMIGEMGCTPVGGDKAAWITAFLPALKTSFPNVRALVWFNINKETDWRFDDTDADLGAFRLGVSDAYYLTSGPHLATAHTRFLAR